MKVVKFVKNGKAVSDFNIDKYVDFIMSSNRRTFRVSSCLILDEIRARVKEKRIDVNDITIMVENIDGKIIESKLNIYGKLSKYPESLNVWSNILTRIII